MLYNSPSMHNCIKTSNNFFPELVLLTALAWPDLPHTSNGLPGKHNWFTLDYYLHVSTTTTSYIKTSNNFFPELVLLTALAWPDLPHTSNGLPGKHNWFTLDYYAHVSTTTTSYNYIIYNPTQTHSRGLALQLPLSILPWSILLTIPVTPKHKWRRTAPHSRHQNASDAALPRTVDTKTQVTLHWPAQSTSKRKWRRTAPRSRHQK